MTIAGGVGDAQELIRIIKAQNEIYKMNEGQFNVPKVCQLAPVYNTTENKMVPYYVQLIVAGVDGDGPQMYELDRFWRLH